jgi:hypothetical protein
LDVLVAKIANSNRFLKLWTRKWEFYSVGTASIAIYVTAQTTVMAATAQSKQNATLRAVQSVFIGYLFDREIKIRHRGGKVNVPRYPRMGVLVVGCLFGIRTLGRRR